MKDREFVIFYKSNEHYLYHKNQTRDQVIKWVIRCGIDKNTRIVETKDCNDEFEQFATLVASLVKIVEKK